MSSPGQSSLSWPALLRELFARRELSAGQAQWAMGEIMAGRAAQSQIGAFAAALTTKGPTAAELTGLAEAMRERAVRLDVDRSCVDLVGTGGDGLGTANISTISAVVAAACGVPVVKHGSRAASSNCGSADVLEALGVRIELGPEDLARCVAEIGIGFCFAPSYHPSLREVAPVRRELRVPTVFNVLGPLANPARPRFGLVGCSWEPLAEAMAEVFASRGDRVAVVRGADGLDELTTTGENSVWLAEDGKVARLGLDAADFGVPRARIGQLRGGDNAAEGAMLVTAVLEPQARPQPASGPAPDWDIGAIRDVVRWNAATAIAVAKGRTLDQAGIGESLREAGGALESGSAAALLRRWVEFCAAL
ncbi:MAG: anthranilate phosphoribosyltransferase [Segniliparus sp.]|uniref:anthranilate phosphoribosyltransferase n=1 Tax=Segniliparus sp. TaxID=2804064 RepID=UPI003F3F5543